MVARRHFDGLHHAYNRRCVRWPRLGRAVRPDRRAQGRVHRRRHDLGRADRPEMAKRQGGALCAVLFPRRGRIRMPVRADRGAHRIMVQRAQGARDRHRHRRRRHRSGHRALYCRAADARVRLARCDAFSWHRLFRHSVSADVPAAARACGRRAGACGRPIGRQSLECAACHHHSMARACRPVLLHLHGRSARASRAARHRRRMLAADRGRACCWR